MHRLLPSATTSSAGEAITTAVRHVEHLRPSAAHADITSAAAAAHTLNTDKMRTMLMLIRALTGHHTLRWNALHARHQSSVRSNVRRLSVKASVVIVFVRRYSVEQGTIRLAGEAPG